MLLYSEGTSLPGIGGFAVLDGDMGSDRDANCCRVLLSKNMHPRVDDERTLAVRILREAHFFQTLAWKRDLAIRRRAFGSIFADESQRAVAKKIAWFAEKIENLNSHNPIFQRSLFFLDFRKGVDFVAEGRRQRIRFVRSRHNAGQHEHSKGTRAEHFHGWAIRRSARAQVNFAE